MKVYLDNGSTTKVAKEVAEAMLPYLTQSYGNASSLHDFGQEANNALEKSRKTIAKKLNAEPEEIIFTSGGSESNNLAIKGVAYANKEKGNHIITTKIEHPAVTETCKTLEKEGFEVTYLDVDEEGFVKLDKLKKAISQKTILVSIMAANNEIGTTQPLKEIGELCSQNAVLFHTDAVQAFTKIPLDVKKQNISLLSLSAHKIHAPKGVGALYVRKGTKIKRLIDGGHQEKNLRAGTENVAGAVAFAKASGLIKKQDIARMTKLRDNLIREILKIPDTKLNGPAKNRLCNNVNVSFKYIEGEGLLMKLNEKGIAVSTGSACSSHELKPSQVLLAIGMTPVDAHGSLRITLSKYTTQKEINYLLKHLAKAVKELRTLSPLAG